MAKEEWELLYDTYFTKTNNGVPFYEALQEEVHEKLGLMTELVYSEDEEIPKIIALKISISDFLIKK